MRDAAVGELDPVGEAEVVLVVVERRDRGRLRPGDLARAARTSAPARAGCAASIRPLRPKNGSLATSSSTLEPERREQLDGPRRATRSRHASDRLAARRSRTISRWWNICIRAGSSGGLVAEHVRAAGVDRHAALRQRAARGDRRVDRVARGRRQHEVGHRLELAPVLVARRALDLLAAPRSSPSNANTLPARCGNDAR